MGIRPRILVAVDFSHSSTAALRYAATLCEPLNATLHVVYVYQPESGIPLETPLSPSAGQSARDPSRTQESTRPPRTLGDLARADARRRLGAMVAQAALDPIQPAEIRVEVGAPHELITTLAEEGRYALIVVGTQSEAGVLGSVAERLLSDAPCPVVTVPAPADSAHLPGG